MNRAIAIGSVLVLGAAAWALWHFLLATPPVDNSAVFEAGNGHAYQFIAAPGVGWDQARAAAAKLSWHKRPGYLATIDSAAEYQFVLDHLFSKTFPDVTYLGGRQTAPGEWRWVTGPDGQADGGKGKLFWRGDETGAMPAGGYANWMATAFQHGGKWDAAKVCCVSLFSYGIPQFSTSLGSGDADEHVAGYLVEFGD
jgi:hypothetical protein